MDARLKTICGLLESPDPLRRCAAAIVLRELAPSDGAVARALGAALPGANQMLTTAILDALDAVGSRDALPHLIPLLDTEDLAIKMRAIGTISKAGAAALPLIQPMLSTVSPSQKLIVVDLLARIPTGEAMRSLLGLLPNADADLAAEIAEAVRRHARQMPPQPKASAHRLIAAFLNTVAAKESERLRGAGFLMMGAVGRPEARTILLRGAATNQPPRVRLSALRALAQLEWTTATAKAAITQVLSCLKDADQAVAQQALHVIEHFPAEALSAAQWRGLLQSSFAPAQGVALARLSADDTDANNRVLLDLLQQEDSALQELAASALAHHPKAAPALLDALLKADTEAETWSLAKILKPHAGVLPARLSARLNQRTARDLQAGRPAAEALLYLLRHADAAAADALLRQHAFAAARAKRWTEAVERFRKLIHTAGFDDECRYALSIANLKLSPKELAPHMRAEDYALRGFQGLLRHAGFDLQKRLTQEKALDPDDLYYVGFHFADMTGAEHDFGKALLRQVLQRWPRSPEGKAAKTRLGPALKARTKAKTGRSGRGK